MARLTKDKRSGNWVVRFYHAGNRYMRSCNTSDEAVAQGVAARIDETLRLLKSGRLTIPREAEPGTWIVSDGKVASKPAAVPKAAIRLGEVCDGYVTHRCDIEPTTRSGEQTRLSHIRGFFGERTKLSAVRTADLQRYVTHRAGSTYRGRPISGKTIRKELVTFSQMWSWAKKQQGVSADCPLYDDDGKWAIMVAKPAERERFQTWDQIKRRVDRGGLKPQEEKDLWASLFLDSEQVLELLRHVKEKAAHPFVYPMFAFLAYTGARRSEICRSQPEDFDFQTKLVKIREKKRRKSKSGSFRFVDMHPDLEQILGEWIEQHPGGQYTLAVPLAVRGRREKEGYTKMTPNEAHHHFRAPLLGTKWEVVRGFHVLRHSFGSNLARAGVQPAQIAAWMGHTTQEMMQLYQHLFPQDGQRKISLLTASLGGEVPRSPAA